jgi:hypothetical protein
MKFPEGTQENSPDATATHNSTANPQDRTLTIFRRILGAPRSQRRLAVFGPN